MPKVTAINISEKKGVIKHPIPEGEFIVDWGLKDDAHGGNWHRQVSLLGQESIDKMTAMGVQGLCTGKFAENLTTEGIELFTLPIGTQLQIRELGGKRRIERQAVIHGQHRESMAGKLHSVITVKGIFVA